MPLLHWENAENAEKKQILVDAASDDVQRWRFARTIGNEEYDALKIALNADRSHQKGDADDAPLWWRMSRREVIDFLLIAQRSECSEGKYDCAVCGQSYLAAEQRSRLEHVIPKADAILNDIFNHVLTCTECNNLKGDKYTLSGARWQIQMEGRRKVDFARAEQAGLNAARMRILLLNAAFAVGEADRWMNKMRTKADIIASFPIRKGVMTPKGRRMSYALDKIIYPFLGDMFLAHRCQQCLAFRDCVCPALMKRLRRMPGLGSALARIMALRQRTILWEVRLRWWWCGRRYGYKPVSKRGE